MPFLNDPSASRALAVTPSDSLDLIAPVGVNGTKYLYLGVTGDVSAITSGGDTVTFIGLAGGVFHPISVRRVRATGTTATGILAVY